MLSLRTGASLAALGVIAACGDDPVPVPHSIASTSSTGAGGAGSGIQIPGLTAQVDAVTDKNGLLHLGCAADDDCFAALGYFHASNRMFFMDFVRNLVRGSLGSLVKAGSVVLERDYVNRQFFATREGQPLEEKLYADASDLVKGHLDAYTRGVNAWLADMRAEKNGATLTLEYDAPFIVKEAIRDWEPTDSAAVGLYVLNDLSNNSASELALAQQLPAFDPALAVDLFSLKPVFEAFPAPSSFSAMAPPPFAADAARRVEPLAQLLGEAARRLGAVGSGARAAQGGAIGSNNWIVGPDRTASKHPLLANDPHLLLTNPSIWFAVEIDGKSAGTGSYHVAGSTFPGLPSVMVGHNESVGWGVTTAYYDLADEYVEQLGPDHKSVVFEGSNVAIFEKEFTFQDVSTGKPVKKTFRWVPHHGPIVSEDDAAGTAITVRWTGHEGGTDLDAFFGLARSATTGEAKKALTEYATAASQNFVVIDVAGDIGWFPYSDVPDRPWASPALPPWMPLPGDGSAEWKGYVPFASLPQLENPPSGVVATANQNMTGANADGDITNDGQPALQAWDAAEGTREQRILDMLEAGGDSHTVETMQQIQGDTYSLYGSVVVPPVVAAAATGTLTPEEQALVDALAAWKLTCPTGLDESDPLADPAKAPKATDPAIAAESIGCTAFHTTLYAIVHEALGDEAAAAMQDLSSSGVDLHLVVRALKDPTSIGSGELLWDDVATMGTTETRDQILVRAIQKAAAALSPLGGPDEWRWGRVHTLSLRSIYDNFGITTYNEGPYAAPGGQYTVNVASPSIAALPVDGKAPDFHFAAGPSVRFVLEATPDGITMSYELPGGADLHRESPFYNNLLPGWLVNEPIDFPFGKDAVKDPASTLVVTPAPD